MALNNNKLRIAMLSAHYHLRRHSRVSGDGRPAQSICLARRFPNFTYTVVLSEPLPEDRWDGPAGFIHQVACELYLGKHEDPTEFEYYLCGSPLMLRAVEKMLDNLWVDSEMVAYDEFGRWIY